MQKLTFVVAASENNVIGNQGKLPWSLPNDLRFFKNTTWGMPVVMGRKTFESFKKILGGRFNVIITRQPDYRVDGAAVAPDLNSAIKKAAEADTTEIFIIGGGEIFRDAMPIVDRIHLTRVHADFEGDAFFPEIDPAEWELVSNEDNQPDEKHKYAYSFQTWERKAK